MPELAPTSGEIGGYRWRVWRGGESRRLLAEIVPPAGRRVVLGYDHDAPLEAVTCSMMAEISAHQTTGDWRD